MSLEILFEELGKDYSRISRLLDEVSEALQAIGIDKSYAPKVLEEIERKEAEHYYRKHPSAHLEWEIMSAEYVENPDKKIRIKTHFVYKDAEGKKEEGSEERVYEVNSYRGSYKLKKAKRQ